MINYIVEFHNDNDQDADAQIQVFNIETLLSYLDGNIQQVHYSGEGDEIIGIYRWDGNKPAGSGWATLTPLKIVSLGEERAPDDYLDWGFRVQTEDGHVEGTFTVRIDGLA